MRLRIDLQFFAGEKTEKATPKKRQDERKKGKVAKSQDVNTAILLLVCFIALAVAGPFMKERVLSLFSNAFTSYIHFEVTVHTIPLLFLELFIEMAYVIAPIMLIAVIGAMAANLMQVGFLFTTEPLKFDLKKIDPIKGAKRIFSIRALVELLKSLFKIVFIGAVTFTIIWINKEHMMMTALKDVDSALSFFGNVTMTMGIAATIALLILAVFDYAYQRWDFEKNLRMSKQDIKDEHKNIEGDPLIQAKIKEKQREFAMRRMMSDVPKADVIITNPTHFSVAIAYDEEKASAPYIVAKGIDEVALKIREIAKAHQIPMVENRQLARSLYASLEIQEVIPEQFYKAIAEILAYVYQVDKTM